MPAPVHSKEKTPIYQNTWQRGMITSSPPEEIEADAARLILNLEFDPESNLLTRNGTSLFLTLTGETGRITSLFRAQYSDGTVWILITTGTKLFRCTESGGSLTNITGALTFPNDTKWQWAMFGDFAIGVNGATSGTNPVKVNAAGTASLLANAPFAKSVEVWNNRLWLVRSATGSQNELRASAINLPEDWTVDDDAGSITLPIDPNDGDFIVGIKAFRGSLYVYKRKKINIVTPIGSPATIPGNLRVDIYTSNIGCLSAYSIQNVIDDQLFLSESGIMSLVLAPLGELKGSIISQNIKELGLLKKTLSVNEIPSTILDDVNQYWVSIPSSVSNSAFNELWSLDYQRISQRDELGFPIVRWTRLQGKVEGTAYSERLDQDYKTYLVAGYPVSGEDTKIYQYQPNNPVKAFNDDGEAYIQTVKTKSFSGGTPLLRSLWDDFGAAIKLISENVFITINYYFNNSTILNGQQSYSFVFDPGDLSLYGMAEYGTDLYGDAASFEREEVIWASFRKNSSGRKARTVALEFLVSSVNQGFILKFIQVNHILLNKKRARTK